MDKRILIVDDESEICEIIGDVLEDEGYVICTAQTADKAMKEFDSFQPDLILLDIWLGENRQEQGLELLKLYKERNPTIPVVMISGHGRFETAVASIKKGAYDFIEKPFETERLLIVLKRALEHACLQQENLKLKDEQNEKVFIGVSLFSKHLKKIFQKVGPTNSRVLIMGEPGTGKELCALMLHNHSQRASEPFNILRCSSVDSPSMVQRFLARTWAGTAVFDEITELPLPVQKALVVQLHQNQSQPYQSQSALFPRILATTRFNPQECLNQGTLHPELYYRLNIVPLTMLPLRQRREDIQPLVLHLMKQASMNLGLPKKTITQSAMLALELYNWPWNVRELSNTIERLLIAFPSDQEITLEALPPHIHEKNAAGTSDILNLPLREAREVFEKRYLSDQINRFFGNISQTAEFIKMDRAALHRKLKQLQALENNLEPE